MADFDKTETLGGNSPPKDNNPSLTAEVDKLLQVFQEVNELYIKKIAEQIKVIGEMNASSINRMMIMAQMNENIAQIEQAIRRFLRYSATKMEKIMQTAFDEVAQNPNFKRAITHEPLSDEAKKRIEQLTKSIARQTNGTMRNLCNTTALNQRYMHFVDRAVLAVISGMGSYTEVMRDTIRELGSNGMQIHYASGYHRRLDSALRANIISAANQVAQQGSDIVSEDLGMNAKELTAHKAPAPDHAPVQGRVFLNAEFEKMQSGEGFEGIDGHKYEGFQRPIGEWNCMHTAMGFDTRYSKRKYTDEELKKILIENSKGCTVNGKKYTTYQANQRMRQIETEIRRQKGVGLAAEKAGDIELQKEAQRKIDRLGADYLQFSKESGLSPKWDRLEVNGFKKYKGNLETKDNPVLEALKDGKINLKLKKGDFDKHSEKSKGYVDGKSPLTVSEGEAQELIDKYHGTGQPTYTNEGEWNNKEIVCADKIIGKWIDRDTGESKPTNRFTIHYSKKGAHLVPAKPDEGLEVNEDGIIQIRGEKS